MKARSGKSRPETLSDRTVKTIRVKFNGIKFEFACVSHGVHTSFQFFLCLKQVPFDSTERNTQFHSNICLFALLKIIRNYNSSLQLGKVRDLCSETADGFRIIIGVRFGIQLRDQGCNFINRNTEHTLCRITIIIAESIVRNCPNEFFHVGNIILNKKSTERVCHNILG